MSACVAAGRVLCCRGAAPGAPRTVRGLPRALAQPIARFPTMFTILALLGYGLAIAAIALGFARSRADRDPQKAMVGLGVGLAIAVIVWGTFWMLDFYGERLWFESLGYGTRFIDIFTTSWMLAIGGGLAAALLTLFIVRLALAPALISWPAAFLAGVLGGSAAMALWAEVLMFRHATMTGVTDPVLGRDVGFYLFRLPLYRELTWPLITALAIGAAAALLTWLVRQGSQQVPPQLREFILPFEPKHVNRAVAGAAPVRAMLVALGLLLLLLAHRLFLGRFGLVIEGTGFPAGAGYVDSHFLIPAHTVLAALFAVAGLGIAATALMRRDLWSLKRLSRQVMLASAALVVAWVVVVVALPAFVQRFRVSPNELAAERPFIERSIAFTRQAFGLDDVEERALPAADVLSPELAASNADILREVPLWDYRALLKVFSQFQEIRLYYEFTDVDIDRYMIGGERRQVMISARELDQSALPEQSRTFLNLRFKYTHGHGVVAVPVAEFTPDGQPRYLVSNIPARSVVPELEVTRPEIYFGELTTGHVYTNTLEPEFDYPAGEQNVETFYEGSGGVVLNSFVRRLAYAKRFDGTRLLLARHVTPESRIHFRRQIRDRVQALAPFLTLDQDPYIVISEGRLFWIVDAYTHSVNYPYSERIGFGRERMNYIRNSVKVVVDAYNGSVDFYIFDEADPIIRTWDRALPGLFQPAAAMPEGLRAHVRYPEGLLMVQGSVFAKYHMRDLTVFYNNEDLWEPAMEKYYAEQQQVEPYYTLWRQPEATQLEFIHMWPFTPRGRNVMAGWIAGGSDGENYGRLFAYRLPKDRQILGPLQFEAKIDQDESLVQLMTLWSQGGSRVIRGHTLSLPLGDAIVHIQPIYLESQSSSFPELQLVAVMQGDHLGYGRSLEEALRMFYTRAGAVAAGTAAAPITPRTPAAAAAAAAAATPAPVPMSGDAAAVGREASEAFERYLRLQGEGRFEEAGRELGRVRALLRQLGASAPQPQPQPQ